MRTKVFGGSLADPFDAEVADDWRADYIGVIEATPWLDWILLTKRPQVARKFFEGRKLPDNLWPGITAENQKMLELRAPLITAIAAKLHVVSAEPLLGPLDLRPWLPGPTRRDSASLTWVIAGGESGPRARPSHPAWFRLLRDQCEATGVPFFFKQWGEWSPYGTGNHRPAYVGAGPDSQRLLRVGKKSAGALLDGHGHRGSPT